MSKSLANKTSTPVPAPLPTPLLESAGQTFLIGEEIYLRRIEKRDAQYVMSLRNTVWPQSPAVAETWIAEGLRNKPFGVWTVVRKADDRPVGTMTLHYRDIAPLVEVHIDPLYGKAGRWTAEVYRLVVPWLRDEIHVISLQLPVAADQAEAIAALEELGCVCSARFREMLRLDGQWVDLLRYVTLHPRWLKRLGNPADTPIVRAGIGEPRPVPSFGTFDSDSHPPKGAMAIGQRVYLKAFDKEDAEALSRFNRIESETGFGHSRILTTDGNKVQSRLEPASFRLRDTVPFAIRRRADDRTIGDCGLQGIDYVSQSAESYSWLYDPATRGEGLGFEAKHLLLSWAFETLGMHSVQSYVAQDNLRSAAALRKQGYREAGRLFWKGTSDGGFTNQIVFDILADEWRSLPKAASSTHSDGA
ncbi:MAG: GNAT family protein [Thermomicrobiales bacterium]